MASPYAPNIVKSYSFATVPTATAVGCTVAADTLNRWGATQSTRVTKTNALGSGLEARFLNLWSAFTWTRRMQAKVRMFIPPNQCLQALQIFLCRSGAVSTENWSLAAGQPMPTGWVEFYLSLPPGANYSHASNGITNVTGLDFYVSGGPTNDYFCVQDVSISERPTGDTAFFITLDDGFSDQQYTNALPAIEAAGFTCTDAIIADYVGDATYMTAAQIQDMVSRGHTVNNHTFNGHVGPAFWNGLSPQERIRYLREGAEFLDSIDCAGSAGIFTVPLGLGHGYQFSPQQADQVFQYATCVMDTQQRAQPVIPRACVRVRTTTASTTGSFVRGDVVSEGGTSITANFSHFGADSGGNTYAYLVLNQTGIPAASGGTTWTNLSRTGTFLTNLAPESVSFSTGRNATPVSDGTGANGHVTAYMSGLWYPRCFGRTLQDYGSTSQIKSDTLAFTDGVYDNTAKTITKVGAFAGITWASGDMIYISAGTGFTPGWYRVSARTNDAVTLDQDPYTGAAVNITGTSDIACLTYINGATALRAITRGSLHQAISRGSVCPLLIHRVLDNGASYDGTHMKVADLERLMNYLAAEVAAGRCAVTTLEEVLESFGIPTKNQWPSGNRRRMARNQRVSR